MTSCSKNSQWPATDQVDILSPTSPSGIYCSTNLRGYTRHLCSDCYQFKRASFLSFISSRSSFSFFLWLSSSIPFSRKLLSLQLFILITINSLKSLYQILGTSQEPPFQSMLQILHLIICLKWKSNDVPPNVWSSLMTSHYPPGWSPAVLHDFSHPSFSSLVSHHSSIILHASVVLKYL